MRTIETGKTVVDIVAWPKNKPWEERYQTSSSIDSGVCKLLLSNEVFHNEAKANTSYRRFANQMLKEGLNPPNVVFRNMVSNASKNIFCILTTTESVFNSACDVGNMYLVESGSDEKRKVCAILLRQDGEGDHFIDESES